jgi:hypothetical protein
MLHPRTGTEKMAVRPFKELCSREMMRAPNRQPRILLPTA